jgi:hypothetical protein
MFYLLFVIVVTFNNLKPQNVENGQEAIIIIIITAFLQHVNS